MSEKLILSANNLVKTFCNGKVRAVNGVSLSVYRGEFVSIMGPSGSGKTSLLMILSAISQPEKGSLAFEENYCEKIQDKANFRASFLGLIFQQPHLIPVLTAEENIITPLHGQKIPIKRMKQKAEELLEIVAAKHLVGRRAINLSAGEQQRIALCRALINSPRLLLADEPTGNLDKDNSRQVMSLLSQMNYRQGLSVVVVTHDPEMAAVADRTLLIEDGCIVKEIKNG